MKSWSDPLAPVNIERLDAEMDKSDGVLREEWSPEEGIRLEGNRLFAKGRMGGSPIATFYNQYDDDDRGVDRVKVAALGKRALAVLLRVDERGEVAQSDYDELDAIKAEARRLG